MGTATAATRVRGGGVGGVERRIEASAGGIEASEAKAGRWGWGGLRRRR